MNGWMINFWKRSLYMLKYKIHSLYNHRLKLVLKKYLDSNLNCMQVLNMLDQKALNLDLSHSGTLYKKMIALSNQQSNFLTMSKEQFKY